MGRSFAVAIAVTLALAACKRPEPIRIGFVTGLTGRHYDLGISSRNGVSLAIAELNAQGGIGGRPLELLVRDDAQDPAVARRAVDGLADAGVVAIIGHATSAMARVTLPIVNARRVLMISPTVSATEFQGKDDWFVMLYPSTRTSAERLAEYLRGRGVRSASVVLDLSNEAYSRAWSDDFVAAFEAGGGRIVRAVPFTSGQVVSYSKLAAEALAPPRPDAVMVVANALDSAAFAQQLRKASPALLVGSDWGFTHDVIAQGGASVEGAVFTQKVNVQDDSPRFVRFRQAYEARFNRPVDFAAILSYEAALLLADALRRDATREGVRRAVLEAGAFEGLQGAVPIDRAGDARRRTWITTIREGRMEVLE